MANPMRVELRRRLCRILRGEYRSDDFDQIFLFLRAACRDRENVTEIGDFIAHREEREKGIVTKRLRRWFDNCHFQVPFFLLLDGRKELDFETLDNFPSGLPNFLEANMDLAKRHGFIREKGLSVRLAQDAFARLKGRIREKEDGTSSLIPHGEYERKLLSILLGMTDCRAAFTLDAVFSEFSNALRSQGLLGKSEVGAFAKCETPVGLFVVSRMHHCTIKIDSIRQSYLTAVFSSDGGGRKINIMAEAPGSDTKISMGFPIFSVPIPDPTWIENRLAEIQNGAMWSFPVELSASGGLDILG